MDERTCDYCGRPLPPGTRSNQRYCGRTHKRQARRQAKRAHELHEKLVTRYPPYGDASLSELDARRREHRPDHWAHLEARRTDPDLAEYTDIHDVPDDDPGDVAWSDQYRVQQAIERIEAEYRALARPLLAQQRRNPGVRLPALVQLELEAERKVSEIVKAHQRAMALERAARRHPATVATAHERALEQAAARSFARDRYGSRHAGRAEPEPAGRPTSGLADW